MPQKPYVSAAVSDNFATAFGARLKGSPDLILILKGIKSFLQLIGQWDRLIAAIAALKDQTPDMIDQVIDMIIEWLQAL